MRRVGRRGASVLRRRRAQLRRERRAFGKWRDFDRIFAYLIVLVGGRLWIT